MYLEESRFAVVLKNLRKERGLSQQELADIIGVRKTTISNYETSYSVPNINILKKIMNTFELPASYFMDKCDIATKKEIQPIFGSTIPFFTNNNIKGIIEKSFRNRDAIINLPKNIINSKGQYIATNVPDHSMNKCGIRCNDCMIINTESRPSNDDIVVAIKDDHLIIRRFKRDAEKMFLLIESTKVPLGRSVEPFPDESVIIIGTVERFIIDAQNI